MATTWRTKDEGEGHRRRIVIPIILKWVTVLVLSLPPLCCTTGKRRKTQSHLYESTGMSTDSDDVVRGPLAPCHVTQTQREEQLATGPSTGDPSSSSTSASSTSWLRPGSSYVGSEVPCIVSGRLPLLDTDTSVQATIDDSGRLPTFIPSDKKDDNDITSHPASHKRRRITLIDDQLLQDSRHKESSRIRPASRSSRLLLTNPTNYTPESAEGRARSRSR